MIGIDIGGTNTRIGLFPSLDAPEYALLAKFPTQQDYEQQLRIIGQVLQEHGIRGAAGIGVSIAARIAKNGRTVIFAPNLPGYIDKPFASKLSALCAAPVRLAHDTVCGLLAEERFGVLRTIERCAYLTVSTGTGAAIQLGKANKRLVSSIEIGHQILDGNLRECLCGITGCLETYTGGRQLELRYGQPVEHITNSAFWETFAEKLSIGLVNLAQLTRIEVVAVSGAIALNTASLLPALQTRIDKLLVPSTLELRLAKLGETAPLVGAASLLAIPENDVLH
jgi:glucokinase